MKNYSVLIILFLILIDCTSHKEKEKYPRELWGGKFANSSIVKSDIWVIGDSYCSNIPVRWSYYIAQNDTLGKILFDKKSGARSDLMFSYFEEDLKKDTPKYLVWAVGMNDNTHFGMPTFGYNLWWYYYNKVDNICKKKKIFLIVCTIPNVPTINNNQKNNFIRQHVKNYIDFDSLVNNGIDNSWKRGWLEWNNTGLHPTDIGAVKMAMYFKERFFEITKLKL